MFWILLGVGFLFCAFLFWYDMDFGACFIAALFGVWSIMYGVGFNPAESEFFYFFMDFLAWFFQPLR